MNSNGQKKEEERICPFLNSKCLGKQCALYTEMMRAQFGLQQKFGMCSFTATVMILSELNMKTQAPQQKVTIPNLIQGRG